jgi:translation elongation factor EF-Tu-like GTPase
MNGKLIYKKWLDTGQSKVFDIMAYDRYTLTSIRDLEYENHNEYLAVKAKVKLNKTEEGGRRIGILSGYRPNHVFEYNAKGNFLDTYIGDIVFDEPSPIEPGEARVVTVRFAINQPIEKYLNKGQKWWIHEGSHVVGEAEMI